MKLLLASSEVHPYSKTGGLADMVASLDKALVRAGHEVGVVTPLYQGIRERFPQMEAAGIPLDIPLGGRRVAGEVWVLKALKGQTVYFIDAPEFFQRAGLYQNEGVDYPDNAERFVFFAKTVAALALQLSWQP